MSISCGVAGYNRGLKHLVADADKCLYRAKSAGKGRVVLAHPKKKPATSDDTDSVSMNTVVPPKE